MCRSRSSSTFLPPKHDWNPSDVYGEHRNLLHVSWKGFRAQFYNRVVRHENIRNQHNNGNCFVVFLQRHFKLCASASQFVFTRLERIQTE